MTLEEIAQRSLDAANACPEHRSDLTWGEVVKVHYAWEMPDSERSYADSASFAVLELPDGRFAKYAVVWEWGDTSGHGCQCDGGVTYHPTLEQAITLGLSRDKREKIGLLTT